MDLGYSCAMRDAIHKTIAVYQILAAGAGYAFSTVFMQQQAPAYLTLLGFLVSTISLLAGLLLLFRPVVGVKLSKINQALQTVGFATPVVTYLASCGISVRLYLGALSGPSLLDTRLTTGANFRLGFESAVAFLKSLPQLPDYMLSVNIVSLLILILLAKAGGAKTKEALSAKGADQEAALPRIEGNCKSEHGEHGEGTENRPSADERAESSR
jgi:hypothetical protein